MNVRRPRPATYQRILLGSHLRLHLFAEPCAIGTQDDGHNLTALRGRALDADNGDDSRATGGGSHGVDGALEVALGDVRHVARLQPVSGQPGLRQAEHSSSEAAGLFDGGNRRRDGLVERRGERR